jgi:hypothetical protein
MVADDQGGQRQGRLSADRSTFVKNGCGLATIVAGPQQFENISSLPAPHSCVRRFLATPL